MSLSVSHVRQISLFQWESNKGQSVVDVDSYYLSPNSPLTPCSLDFGGGFRLVLDLDLFITGRFTLGFQGHNADELRLVCLLELPKVWMPSPKAFSKHCSHLNIRTKNNTSKPEWYPLVVRVHLNCL